MANFVPRGDLLASKHLPALSCPVGQPHGSKMTGASSFETINHPSHNCLMPSSSFSAMMVANGALHRFAVRLVRLWSRARESQVTHASANRYNSGTHWLPRPLSNLSQVTSSRRLSAYAPCATRQGVFLHASSCSWREPSSDAPAQSCTRGSSCKVWGYGSIHFSTLVLQNSAAYADPLEAAWTALCGLVAITPQVSLLGRMSAGRPDLVPDVIGSVGHLASRRTHDRNTSPHLYRRSLIRLEDQMSQF
jgi:hypothetical protein